MSAATVPREPAPGSQVDLIALGATGTIGPKVGRARGAAPAEGVTNVTG
jgi:hypothetical protein